jgi:catechol 2,3-dioxygenase-like lactoylglutathione lyase family enzyme
MRLKALHHVSFAVTNISETERFASDFGLETVTNDGRRLHMRTSGGDAYSYVAEQSEKRRFQSISFLVEDHGDLEEALSEHGATPIKELGGPGGGSYVSLTCPEGITYNLVHGIKGGQPQEGHPPLRINAPVERSRFSEPQAGRPIGPAKLFRLGHVGLYVKDFAATSEWLQRTLGLRLSDQFYAGDPSNKVSGFLRLDRGEEWVDHHTIFLAQMGKTDCHHISFEVQDYEAQFRTHRWLKQQGWEPNWGVGRHPLGSHVFDVWFDPDRYRFETFSDTDLINSAHEAGTHSIANAEMDVWSSDPPDRYFE